MTTPQYDAKVKAAEFCNYIRENKQDRAPFYWLLAGYLETAIDHGRSMSEEFIGRLTKRNAELEGKVASLQLEVKSLEDMLSAEQPEPTPEPERSGCQFCEKMEKADRRVSELLKNISDKDAFIEQVNKSLDEKIAQCIRLQNELDVARKSVTTEVAPAASNPVLSPDEPIDPGEAALEPPTQPEPKAQQAIIPGMEPMVDKRKKRTPLQNWIVGAALYAEAIEKSAGMDADAAKVVIDWAREQKLLKPAFERLGPSELTRRWAIFQQDANTFLDSKRTFSFFASHVDEFRRPLKRAPREVYTHEDAKAVENELHGAPGYARRLPLAIQFAGEVDKALSIMARAEKD